MTTADTEATISFKLLLVQCAGESLAAVWATSFTGSALGEETVGDLIDLAQWLQTNMKLPQRLEFTPNLLITGLASLRKVLVQMASVLALLPLSLQRA